jgi:hypothetical protein
MDWSTWVQDVGAGLIDKAAGAKYVQPYEIQKLQLEALGQSGYYNEGQAGTRAAAAGGMNTTMLFLIGGAVLVAVVMLKD